MSSTDDRFAGSARRFFDERLMRAARELAGRGVQALAPGPEAELETYYRERPRRRTAREDLVVEGLDAAGGLDEALAEFWRRRDRAELSDLADALAELAAEARSLDDESDEVSPFIYVMF